MVCQIKDNNLGQKGRLSNPRDIDGLRENLIFKHKQQKKADKSVSLFGFSSGSRTRTSFYCLSQLSKKNQKYSLKCHY